MPKLSMTLKKKKGSLYYGLFWFFEGVTAFSIYFQWSVQVCETTNMQSAINNMVICNKKDLLCTLPATVEGGKIVI